MHLMIALMVLTAAPVPSAWVVIKTPHFTANFPIKPKVQNVDVGTEYASEIHRVAAKLADGRLLELNVARSAAPKGEDGKLLEFSQAHLVEVQSSIVKAGPLRLISEKPTTVVSNGVKYLARDFTGADPDGRKFSVRLIIAGEHFFQLMTLHPLEKPLDELHAYFVESFRPAK